MGSNRKRKKSFFYFLLILGAIGLVGVLTSLTAKHIKKSSKIIVSKYIKVSKAHAASVSASLNPSIMASASPTASVTATPAPAGYCLNVPVLFYHHVQPMAIAEAHKNKSLTVDNSIFDTQMSYIASHGYTAISAKQLVDALKAHTALPGKSIVITLDDGYRDNYTYAYPILQKYHFTANIMLASGLMEGSDYLTWGEISEMKGSGLIYYTDHTWSHYAVNHGANDKIQYEIQTAKQQIEARTGQATDLFTYPYGSFNNNAIALLQQDGFSGAFSTLPGKTQCDSYIMTLHRTRIGNAPLSQYGI